MKTYLSLSQQFQVAGFLFILLLQSTALALDPLDFTPAITIEGTSESSRFGSKVIYAGDVNGDGFDDLVVAASEFTDTLNDQGQISLFLGSPEGPSTTASWTYTGTQADERLGSALASLGDVNGDGFDDFAVSSTNFDDGSGGRGKVHVFHGSADGPGAEPDWVLEPLDTLRRIGHSIAGDFDINRDGFNDIVIGAPSILSQNFGKAYVFHGSASGLSPTPNTTFDAEETTGFGIPGPEPTSNDFAHRVLGLGSIDGSGENFILITAPGYLPDPFGIIGYVPGGRVYLYKGSSEGASTTAEYILDGAASQLGIDAFATGDINNDGLPDFILGHNITSLINPAAPNTMFPYFGSPTGPQAQPSITGTASGPSGDFNNDGFIDLIVGEPKFCPPPIFIIFPAPPCPPQNSGRAAFHLGVADSFDRDDILDIALGTNVEELASSLTAKGDCNGDGGDDLVVGIPSFDEVATDQGRVQIFFGLADADGDEIVDSEDICDGFSDILDDDLDGTPNGCDQCLEDSEKSTPLVCGCGVAETDGDGDGTLDCIDQCPADPAKTEPGACGCSIADVDTNGNGIIDCLPQQDTERLKDAAILQAESFAQSTRFRGFSALRKSLIRLTRHLKGQRNGLQADAVASQKGTLRKLRSLLRRLRFLHNRNKLSASRRQKLAARIVENVRLLDTSALD